jgi:hypothetical protein
MRLLLTLFLMLSLPLFAQNTAAPARPISKLVLTNSMDAITGTGPGRRPAPTGAVPVKPTASIPLVTPAAASPSAVPVALGEDVWAEGEGIRVTSSSVGAKVSKLVAEAAANGKTLSEREINEFRARTLNTMVFVQLVLTHSNAADTNRARFESSRRIEGIIKSAPSEEVFWKAVGDAGYTQDSFKAEKFEEALVVTVLDREVKALVKIPDSDIRKYYDEDETRWKKPEQVRAAQIFFAAVTPEKHDKLPDGVVAAKRKKAEETLAKLKAGGDFAALARELSEDVISRERGGEYVMQKQQMFPEFDQAAWSMKPGEISELVTSALGFHIFRKIEVVPARVIPLTEVSEQIREMLVQREMEVRIPEFADRLRNAAGVRLSRFAPRPLGF